MLGDLPPAYMTASIMEDIHAISLYEVWNISWISLKNTVMALGNAYENPIEINEAKTTTHPHPPSGGVWESVTGISGIFSGDLLSEKHNITEALLKMHFDFRTGTHNLENSNKQFCIL